MQRALLGIIVTATSYIILVCCVALPASAAGLRVQGTVKDSLTSEPLPGATVLLVGTSMGTATNLEGRFEILDVPPGTYTIRTTYVGYVTAERHIRVDAGTPAVVEIRLIATAVQGKEMVVTAQASGQNAAINQQLSSLQIKNVVSAAKIQELPDANAAESVGRLPGISVIREGGEAAEIVIRGLAPQYNEITIDGVQIPGNVNPGTPSDLVGSSNFGDRAVDLSMVSSNMLGGIEVTKAITPDMDAAALGGVVNFSLREAQSSIPELHFLAQGGYDNLKDAYDNYKLVLTGENRFLDDRFGVFAELDAEQRNLSANQLGTVYNIKTKNIGVPNRTYLMGVTLTDTPRLRERYDGTVTLDYKVDDGRIDFMTFYSYGKTNEQDRSEDFNLIDAGNTHVYSLTDQRDLLSVMSNILDVQKGFGAIDVDAKLSHSYSLNQLPYSNSFQFQQNYAGFSDPGDENLNPQQIPPLANDSLEITRLFGLSAASSITKQRNITGSLDLKTSFNLSESVTSTLKFGGEYMYTYRSYNYTQSDGNDYYATITDVIQGVESVYPWMTPTVNRYGFILPLVADSGYSYGNFLGGGYKMGLPMNVGLMDKIVGIAEKYGTLESWSYNAAESGEHNYSGEEFRSAGYAMAVVNIGSNVTLLPGVRYQILETRYTAPRANTQLGPISRYYYAHHDTTFDLAHGFWLPMVHLRYSPLSWLQLHLAYTNTLSYPDFSALTPELQVGTNSVDYHNYLLKPAHSSNYDAVASVYDNTIGLFSLDGFYKRINDLIFSTGTTYVINPAQYPGIPGYAAGYSLNTSINNPFPAEVWGIEVEWDTHLWYLPGPLAGLVLSANYTHVYSRAKYPYTYLNVIRNYPLKVDTINTYYNDHLLDQPNDIANLSFGYDIGGFSIRLSMLTVSTIYEAYNFWPELRSNTQRYLRWDGSVKQDLPWDGLQLFLDLNNINGARDTQVNQGANFPSAEDFYGMSGDIGVRLKL